MNIYVFPDGVGPHEEKELELMLLNKKNIAMFEVVPEDFQVHIENGRFKQLSFDDYTHVVYVSSSQNDVNELVDVIKESRNKGVVERLERRTGELLGYTKSEIDAYIKHISHLLKNE